MKKVISSIILILFCITIVSALDDLGKFNQGECVRITQTCATCSYVNISSVTYPNSSVALGETEMVSAGSGEWYYDFCDTAKFSGRYDVRGQGDLDGVDTSFATYFIVGNSLTWIIIIFIFAFGFLIFSLFVNEELFVYISGVSFLLAGVVIMINGIDIVNDWTTRAIAFISLGLGLLFSIGAYIYNYYRNNDDEEEY